MHSTTQLAVQGRLAQLGEHLPYKEGVTGSRPVSPTTFQRCNIDKFLATFMCFPLFKWAISSVGRAPPLQGGGHWFETGIAHHLNNLQTGFYSCYRRAISSVGRAPPLQGGGHWFETGIAHHFDYVLDKIE